MAVDADFEHARLLKIHTSVVVSARSVMGVYGIGAGVFTTHLTFEKGGVPFNHYLTCNTPTTTLLYISTLSGYLLSKFDMASNFSRAGVHNHM